MGVTAISLNLFRPFEVIWGWYKARHIAWRTLLGFLFILAALILLYTVARALQYAAVSGEASRYLPERADIVVELPALEDSLRRLRRVNAWKTIDKKLLREPGVRGPINDAMKESLGIDLDDLEDQRWHEEFNRNWGFYLNEPNLMVAAGRDVAAAVNIHGSQAEYCAATRLGFREYLIAPLAFLFSGVAGIQKETIRGHTYLKHQGVWITTYGAILVASNSKPLLEAGLNEKRKREELTHPIRVELDFTASRTMQDLREEIALGPLGALLRDVDLSQVNSLALEGNLEERDLILRSSWAGAKGRRGKGPVDLLSYAAENCAGAIVSTTGARELWRWMQEALAPVGSQNGLITSGLVDAVRAIQQSSFEAALLPRLGDGSVWILGSEMAEYDGKRYPAAVLAIPVSEGGDVYQVLRQVIYDAMVLQGMTTPEEMFTHSTYQDYPYSELHVKQEIYQQRVLGRACFAARPDALFLSNNPDLLRKVLDASLGEGKSLIHSASFRSMNEAMKTRGLNPFPGKDASMGMFLLFDEVFSSTEGTSFLIAKQMLESDRLLPGRLRQQLQKEGYSNSEIDDLYNDRFNAKIRTEARGYRRQVKFLKRFKWLSVQARGRGKSLELNLVLRLR